jgi:hypothetical protein
MRAPEAVINGKLLSCLDFLETVQEDFPADSAHSQIWITAMINELGAASSYGSIELRAPIQLNRVNTSCFPRQEHPHGAAHGLALADPLAGILDDPLTRRDRFFGEHAKPFNARTANAQLKTGEFRLETRTVTLGGHITVPSRRGRQAAIGNPMLDNPTIRQWCP